LDIWSGIEQQRRGNEVTFDDTHTHTHTHTYIYIYSKSFNGEGIGSNSDRSVGTENGDE